MTKNFLFFLVLVFSSLSVFGIDCTSPGRPALPVTFDGFALDCNDAVLTSGSTVTASHLGRSFFVTVDANGQYGVTGGPLTVERCTNEPNDNITFSLNSREANQSLIYNPAGDYQAFNLTQILCGGNLYAPVVNSINITPTNGSFSASVGAGWNYTDADANSQNGTVYTWYVNGTEAWRDDSLIVYWKFDVNASDEVSSINLTESGRAELISQGIIRSTYDLDGPVDYLWTEDPILNLTDGPITLSTWFRVDNCNNEGGGSPGIAGWGSGATGAEANIKYLLYLYNDCRGFKFDISNGTESDDNAGQVNLVIESRLNSDQWYHVVATWDGEVGIDNVKIYLNGILKGATNSTIDKFNENLGDDDFFKIGVRNQGVTSVGWLDGQVDEVRIYNRSLSANEISNIYSMMDYGQTETFESGSPQPDVPIAAWHFDETEGTTAYDFFGGNDGTVTGSTIAQNGYFGTSQAYSLDGIDDFISIPMTSQLNFTEEMTVEAWCYISNITETSCVSSHHHTGDAGNGWLIFLNTDSKFYFQAGNGTTWSVYSVTSDSITSSGWYHIIGTHNLTTHSIYVNGVESASTGGPMIQNESAIFIGRNLDSPDSFYNMTIDELVLYNRSLTAEEVNQSYLRTYPLFGFDKNKFGHGSNLTLQIEPSDGASNGTQLNSSLLLITDSTYPALTSVNISVTSSSSATVSIETDEGTNKTLNYSTSVSLADGSLATATGFELNETITLSSLSASTTYYFNLTVCDSVNLCVENGTYSFTTDASSSSSSSSGGGGSSSSSSTSSGGSSGLPAPSSSSSSSSTSTSSGGGSIEPVPPQDIVNTLPSSWDSITVTPVGSSQSSNSATIDQIQSAVSDANGASTLQTIGESLSTGAASVSKATTKLEVFQIVNNETKEEVYRTKVTVVVEPQEYDQKDVRVLEVIPKSAAMSVKELSFIHPPTILQDDPVVLWNIPYLKAGETRSFEYFILKRVDSLSDQTLVTGTRVTVEEPAQTSLPPLEQSSFIWTMLGILAVVIVFGIFGLLYVHSKKRT